MRNLAAALLLSATMASAAFAAEPPSRTPGTAQGAKRTFEAVKSVWRVTDDAGFEHLQSGLLCPLTVEGFRRRSTSIYDGMGMDVACVYGASGAGALIVSITPMTRRTIAEEMAAARQSILDKSDRHPVFQAGTSLLDGGLTWQAARYTEDGDLLSELRLAQIGGWLVQYQATYRPGGEPLVEAAFKAMTAVVTASAGPRLETCASARPVVRKGKRVGTEQARQDAMMAGLLGGAMLNAAKEQAAKGDPAEAVEPVIWCAEQGATRDGFKMIFWRGVREGGGDAASDRVTFVSRDEPPTLLLGVDGMVGLISSGRPPRWSATIESPDQVMIYGSFTGRPTVDDAFALFADILGGKTEAVGGYGASGDGNITIIMPSK